MTESPNSLSDKIGIESTLLGPVPGGRGAIRAQVRIDNSAGMTPFPKGDWLEVEVRARVYDLAVVQQLGAVPDQSLADGPRVLAQARIDPVVVDLTLPPMPFGQHGVVAKVYSVDERYKKVFEPSHCYLGVVTYGLRRVMKLALLQAVYDQQTGNPLAEATIRAEVRRGGVVAQDDNGGLFQVREAGGNLQLDPMPFE